MTKVYSNYLLLTIFFVSIIFLQMFPTLQYFFSLVNLFILICSVVFTLYFLFFKEYKRMLSAVILGIFTYIYLAFGGYIFNEIDLGAKNLESSMYLSNVLAGLIIIYCTFLLEKFFKIIK
jgi:hypothetical protein